MYEPEPLDEFAKRMGTFMKNRAAFPEEELMKYAGQWIAWSPDGTSILVGSTESDLAVYEFLKLNGHDPAKCLVTYVPGDEVFLGAASMIVGEEEEQRVVGDWGGP